MDPIVAQKTIDVITDAGKEAVSLIINKTTGDNHPEYEKAVISGTAEAIKELAKSDTSTNVRIYESLKTKREKRDFYNFSRLLQKLAILIKIKPKEKVADDNDLFWGLLEHAKEISNEEMQELIAKIIAGEYNTPGSYSMQTLQILKMLGKSELELFEKICNLLVDDSLVPRELFSFPASAKDLMNELNIDFSSLQTLQSLGLFLPNDMTFSIENPTRGNLVVSYFDKKIIFTPQNDSSLKIQLPAFYGLSPVGKQILKHLNTQYNEKYFNWLEGNYKIGNYKKAE